MTAGTDFLAAIYHCNTYSNCIGDQAYFFDQVGNLRTQVNLESLFDGFHFRTTSDIATDGTDVYVM